MISIFKNISHTRISAQFARDAKDCLIAEVTMMNGLRASNVIELRVKDALNAVTNKEYPGQKIIENEKYKTSSIYGEKLVAIPDALYQQLLLYIEHCIPMLLNIEKSTRMFVCNENKPTLSQSNV